MYTPCKSTIVVFHSDRLPARPSADEQTEQKGTWTTSDMSSVRSKCFRSQTSITCVWGPILELALPGRIHSTLFVIKWQKLNETTNEKEAETKIHIYSQTKSFSLAKAGFPSNATHARNWRKYARKYATNAMNAKSTQQTYIADVVDGTAVLIIIHNRTSSATRPSAFAI